MRQLRSLVVAGLAGLVLIACENSASSYIIDTNQHALILIREQAHFWSNKVDQSIIVSRLPHCQRKVRIHADVSPMNDMRVFDAGEMLWALQQGDRWYLAGTEKCLIQDWDKPDDVELGEIVGVFKSHSGKVVFELGS